MPTMDPEIAALLHQFGVDGPPPPTPPTIDQMRAGNRMLSLAVAPDPPLEVGSVRDDTIAGVPVRTYRPAANGVASTIIFMHGGGFVVGDLDTHDSVCRRLCRDLGAVVVSVGYRLAPEDPFPAAHDDCFAVARYVSDNIADFGGGKLAVVGDSAGGNLAAATAQFFRNENRPLAAQLLAYPSTDMSGKGEHPSLVENATGFLLTTAEAQHNIAVYLGDNTEAKDGPPASPLLASDFTGLAPAVVGCGACDPLRDEGLAYADAMAAAGVPVRKHTFPGLIHGFLNFDTKSSAVDAAVTQMFSELGELLKT